MVSAIAGKFPDAVSPLEWGAAVDYDAKTWTPFTPDKWVLHWGGNAVRTGAAQGIPADEMAQLRSWEYFHKYVKGWLGIAYNYAIGNSGTLYRLRGDNRSGATSGDHEPDGIPENLEAVAVVFIIGSGQSPSDAALATFRRMWRTVPLGDVIGHRDVFAHSGTGTDTQCPGDELAQWITDEGYKEGASPERGIMKLYIEAVPVDGGGDGKTRYYDMTHNGLVNMPATVAAPLLDDLNVVRVVFGEGTTQAEWDTFVKATKPTVQTVMPQFPAYVGELTLTPDQ